MDDEKKLYLLFSADVINSTAMKSKLASKSAGWLPIFKRFYKAFPKLVMSKSSAFNIWKYVGDELLFYVEITELSQIPSFVDNFKQALVDWNDIPKNQVKDEEGNTITIKNHPFLKGCIWLAQTPKIDKALIMEYEPSTPGKKTLLDFVGPSIDCGFRIAKFASQNHLILSAEVLQECANDNRFTDSLYYLNSEFLKGVFNGEKDYPIFFLLLDKQSETIDLELRQAITSIIASKYLNKFYRQFSTKKYSRVISRITPTYFQYTQPVWNFYTSQNFIKSNKTKSQTQQQKIESHIIEMKKWFLNNYEDPAEHCPFESREGGYFYMNGGPYNAEEVLCKNFDYPEEEIKEAAEQLENENSVYDWEKK